MKITYLLIVVLSLSVVGFVRTSDKEVTPHSLKVNELSNQSEFALSLNNVTMDVLAASLLLCNTFGRLALVGCLGYKAYASALKALQDKERRIKHGMRALCYFGASCMLLCDGYQWVLSQGAKDS